MRTRMAVVTGVDLPLALQRLRLELRLSHSRTLRHACHVTSFFLIVCSRSLLQEEPMEMKATFASPSVCTSNTPSTTLSPVIFHASSAATAARHLRRNRRLALRYSLPSFPQYECVTLKQVLLHMRLSRAPPVSYPALSPAVSLQVGIDVCDV